MFENSFFLKPVACGCYELRPLVRALLQCVRTGRFPSCQQRWAACVRDRFRKIGNFEKIAYIFLGIFQRQPSAGCLAERTLVISIRCKLLGRLGCVIFNGLGGVGDVDGLHVRYDFHVRAPCRHPISLFLFLYNVHTTLV